MSETDAWLIAAGVIAWMWVMGAALYYAVHDCWPKWWAIPFAVGAVMFDKRLPERAKR